MPCRDHYGYALTTSPEAAAAYSRGLLDVLRLKSGALPSLAWHAALHELSLGDLSAVRRRYDAQLRPEHGLGCRALVDTGSLLFRWALTPDSTDVPGLEQVAALAGRDVLERPATPFLAMHGAVTLLALDDRLGLDRLARWADAHAHPTQREVVAPLARALRRLTCGRYGEAADDLAALALPSQRLGGSDARLDRRHSPRDARWLRQADRVA